MKSKKHRESPEFETIQAAIEGDAEAINQVLSYFQPFIKSECKREYKDEFGRMAVETAYQESVLTPVLDQDEPEEGMEQEESAGMSMGM